MDSHNILCPRHDCMNVSVRPVYRVCIFFLIYASFLLYIDALHHRNQQPHTFSASASIAWVVFASTEVAGDDDDVSQVPFHGRQDHPRPRPGRPPPLPLLLCR